MKLQVKAEGWAVGNAPKREDSTSSQAFVRTAQASPLPPVRGGWEWVQLGSREGSSGPWKGRTPQQAAAQAGGPISGAFPVTGTKSRVVEGALPVKAVGRNRKDGVEQSRRDREH